MFNINGWELLIIGVVAVLVIGPKRLPDYVAKLRNFIKEARRMASGAQAQLRDETGVDLTGVDWKRLDPRQYDPRRIIREALLDDDAQPKAEIESGANPAAVAVAAQPATGIRSVEETPVPEFFSLPSVAAGPRLSAGEPAPFDDEAT